LTIYFVATGRRLTAPYERDGEDDLKDTIVDAADRIEAGNFPPDTSFCPRCDFRGSCAYSVAKN
jgi:hypothetical protein